MDSGFYNTLKLCHKISVNQASALRSLILEIPAGQLGRNILHPSDFREISKLEIGKLISSQNFVMEFIMHQKINASDYLKQLKHFTLYMDPKLSSHVVGFLQIVF